MKDATHDVYVDCPAGENNTWNLKLDLTEDDFMSLDDPSLTVTGEDLSKIPGILGPRNPDGSVPDLDFLKLKEGSRAIDKGENIGQFFVGEAPDLGAYEFGMIKSSSSAAGSSNSVAESSSSDSTTSINTNVATFKVISGEATVFDLQGRYLGTLQLNQLRGETIQSALHAKFKTPGTYLIRQGNRLQIFYLSP